MKKLFTFVCLWAVSCVAFSAMAQELNGNIYTIHCRANNSGTVGYMQDNKSSDNRIEIYSLNDASYWRFIATGNDNCYYIKNVSTGRYIQGYTTSEQIVTVGSLPVEYYVAKSTSYNDGSYGMACTSLTPHDFSSGTIGLNLHGESNESDCYAQSFAAQDGTNGRSFWILEGGTPYIGVEPGNYDEIFLYSVATDSWIQDNDYDTAYWTSYAHLGSRGRDMRLISEGGGGGGASILRWAVGTTSVMTFG